MRIKTSTQIYHKIQLIVILFLIQIKLSASNNANCAKTATRPLYLIGHMSNSIGDVKEFISSGANAVEIDIQFTEDGLLDLIYHGIPCDCFRYCNSKENVDSMFKYLKMISSPGYPDYMPHFTLVLFDLKIRNLSHKAKETAGIMVADKLIDILYENEQGTSQLKVVTGIELTMDYLFVFSLINRFKQRNYPSLLKKIGFDVSGNERIERINYFWNKLFKNELNVWQGDGITNCLSYIRPTQRIKDLIKIRENNLSKSYLSKVYHWTIDSKWKIKNSLRLSVDGLITNDIKSVIEILKEDEFSYKYHLANKDDDPFCIVRDDDLDKNEYIRNREIFKRIILNNYVAGNNKNVI